MLCSLYKSSLDFWIMKPVSLLNRIKWEFCNVIISKVIIFLSSSADPMTQSDSKAESHIFWRVKLSSSFSLALEVNSENVNPSISNEKGTKWVWNCASYDPVLYFLRLAAFHCDKITKIASNQFEQAQIGWNCDFQNPEIRVIKIEIPMLSQNEFWKYFHMRLFTILNHSYCNIADFLQPTTALQFVKKQFRNSFFFLLSTYTNSIPFLFILGILIFSYSRWIISIRYHREASYILPNG